MSKKITQKSFIHILFALIVAVLTYFSQTYPQKAKVEAPTVMETAVVIKVVDGDTIKLDNGKTVRYIGIDTPEIHNPNKKIECFGQEAAAENTRLLMGKQITLIKDTSETDRYGRILRYVYLDGIFINELLVKNGYARAITYPPDTKFEENFKKAEMAAQEQKLGLWGKCKK